VTEMKNPLSADMNCNNRKKRGTNPLCLCLLI